MGEFESKKKELLSPIFLEAGAALYDCQTFEYGISYLLYLLARLGVEGLDPNRLTRILDNEEKKTAGQLIDMLKKHVQVSDSIEDSLAEALRARNKLIHRYLVENAERFLDRGERRNIVTEIRALRSKVRGSFNELDPFVQCLVEQIDGLNINAVSSQVKEQFLKDSYS